MGRRTGSVLNRLLLLNGLAIVAVVANHGTAWGITDLFWWADRYRPVTAPNYDAYGGACHLFLLVMRKLTVFCVPAFLFVSGLFVSYMLRGKANLPWKAVRMRITNLLIPYLVWNVVRAGFAYSQGEEVTLLSFLKDLVIGQWYFYIPLLCQLLLISPFLLTAARDRVRTLVIVAVVSTALYIGVHYVSLYGALADVSIPWADWWAQLPSAVLLRWWLFFVVGLIAGFRVDQLKTWTYQYRWYLLAATVGAALLAVFEALFVFWRTDLEWWTSSILTLPTTLYVLGFTLCFVAFLDLEFPQSAHLRQLGQATLGIYFLHGLTLEIAARAIQRFFPWFLAYQALFYVLIVIVAVEIPRLLMMMVAKSPGRRLHPYLFG